MDGESLVVTQKIYSGASIAASGTAYTDIQELRFLRGSMSLFIDVTGDGTITVTPYISHDPIGVSDAKSTWTVPYDSSGTAIEIASALTKATGPSSDGQHIYPVEIPPGQKVKFLITETSTTDAERQTYSTSTTDAVTPIIRIATQ
jgi:hypothetical protein